ncbi:MAG: hypothetical protein SH848_08215 [Saprospiraceae bacterium]|nr:hypothetical protein [Saprospiraceae bacterium]MDZ4703899.1 hypothetical protein [Saprospiraceae bacterium]
MITLQEKKYRLIEMLMRIEDEQILNAVESQITQVNPKTVNKPSFRDAVKPIRKTVSFQELLVEQNYKPIPYETFRKMVSGIGIEEPVEELLNMLSVKP